MPAPPPASRIRSLIPRFTLRRPAPEPGSEPRRWLAVVLSIGIAFVLWFTFSMREVYSLVVEMPIVVQRVPEGQALAEPPQPVARVTVQGEGWDLLGLRQSPPALDVYATSALVDLNEATAEMIKLPASVTVQNVAPSQLDLALDAVMSRRVPIEPMLGGVETDPLFDFVGRPRVSPDSVTVTGARSIVRELRAWPTARVRRSGVREPFEVVVPLADTLDGLVRTSVEEVRVAVHVDQFTEWTREVPVQVVETPPGGVNVRFVPERVQVTYRVSTGQFEAAQEADDFFVFVPYSRVVTDTTGTVRPLLSLPQGLTLRDARVEPRRLQYYIRLE